MRHINFNQRWACIKGYDRYEISESGDIRNIYTDRYLAFRQNQQGIVMVNLVDDERVPHTLSVAVLVATHFCEPPVNRHYDTVTHLNGRKDDFNASNLVWRPRHFAIRYHQQFKKVPDRRLRYPVVCLDTDEVFDRPIDAAAAYGLLEADIVRAALDKTPVWPLNYEFREYTD